MLQIVQFNHLCRTKRRADGSPLLDTTPDYRPCCLLLLLLLSVSDFTTYSSPQSFRLWLGGEFGFTLVFGVLTVRDSSPFEAVAQTADSTGVFTPALSCARAPSDCNPIAKKKKKDFDACKGTFMIFKKAKGRRNTTTTAKEVGISICEDLIFLMERPLSRATSRGFPRLIDCTANHVTSAT